MERKNIQKNNGKLIAIFRSYKMEIFILQKCEFKF